jgi:hypothetical protein
MAELKTKKTTESVDAFLRAVQDPQKQSDCRTVAKMMKAATGAAGKMWGTSIVGFGSYHYKYASGQEGDWPLAGFSPRKQNLVLYIMAGFSGAPRLMKKLGKYRTGKSCLYLKRLSDVDLDVLRQLIDASVAEMRKRYPASGASPPKKAAKKKAAKKAAKKGTKKKATKKKGTKKKATKKKTAKRKPAKKKAAKRKPAKKRAAKKR